MVAGLRAVAAVTASLASHAGVEAVLDRIYAARGVADRRLETRGLAALAAPEALSGLAEATEALAQAIGRGERILVIGDYDADGATGTALAVRGLHRLGARDVHYLIPDRVREGYGLSPAIVERAATFDPHWIMTVDNGINSLDGARAARERGLHLIITDHHLPGATLPQADAIVNPNQPGDLFASKALAGVGVVLYVLIALRRRLAADQVALADLLGLVALGTVADCVPLDANNRVLVREGLRRLNAGQACPGIEALLLVSGKRSGRITAQDLGFQVGPRLNAAGRLADMGMGVRCLLTDDRGEALRLARELDALNRERREREAQMQAEAHAHLSVAVAADTLAGAICLMEPHWHPGVVGILAGRLKDTYKRPAIVFAPAEGGALRGSGRSVPSLNLRDTLAVIGERHTGLIRQFGGHAAAAGLTIARDDYPRFAAAFVLEVERRIGCGPYVDEGGDGPLRPGELTLALAAAIRAGGPWGNGFPEPLFEGVFEVLEAVVVKDAHLRLRLAQAGGDGPVKAMVFRCTQAPKAGSRIHARYHLGIDDFGGREAPCLYLAQWSAVSPDP
ncbi:single-stranded-DNA-specific exonuclease RecJ [Acidiferrobacter sp.]|uniref:single-stranded-DNA-specific exonuclease RecJ n=1 Tax=Acidiferrobacter sp. TaxID=1872107 RepID=UPI00260FC5DB|nr:single-stranded-DNA-specific exonuclease RecJ [Acidiferrobacter sp.]